MKMLKYFISTIEFVALLLLLVTVSFAGELSDPLYNDEIIVGMDAILSQQFGKAKKVAAKMVMENPRSPAGHFLLATCLSAEYYDTSDTSIVREMHLVANKVLSLTEGDKSPVSLLYRGAVYAYSSVVLAKEDRWFVGARQGKKSADIFKSMVKARVVSSDAHGMLGAYYYWTSAFIHKFAWLPFIQDKRDEGIKLIEKSIDHSKYMKFALINSLLWIYYDHGKYNKALKLCEKVLTDYPGHRIFLQAKMHILYKKGDYNASRDIAIKLIKEWKDKEVIPVNMLNVKIKLAIIYYSMGKKELATPLALEALKYRNNKYVNMRLSKEFGYLADAAKDNKQEIF